MRSQPVMRMRFLLTLGKYCMSIYLLNTIFIGLTKGVMFHFFDWDGNRFLVYFVMLGGGWPISTDLCEEVCVFPSEVPGFHYGLV
jgi:hypothetical protein